MKGEICMNKKKSMIAGVIAALALGATSITAFAAAAYSTPAEVAAAVTGKTVEQVTALRQGGTTYGAIAAEVGKLEEFQQAVQQIYKDALDARVADGKLTQEQADQMLAQRAERQSACDGSGNGGGCGLVVGSGRRVGGGMGGGRGMQNGSCLYR